MLASGSPTHVEAGGYGQGLSRPPSSPHAPAEAKAHKGQQANELPLILFTLLTPMSVGVSAFALLCGSGLAFALLAVLLATAGMAASIAHLARPLRAPYSILHWKTSWLSREILAVSVYWALAVLWCLAALFAPGAGALALPAAASEPLACVAAARAPAAALGVALNALALVGGIALLFVIARAYRLAPIPAWDGSENVLELLAIALGPGVALAMAAAACLVAMNTGCSSTAAILLGGGAGSLVLQEHGFGQTASAAASLVVSLMLDWLAYRRRIARLEAADDTCAAAVSRARCLSLCPKVRRYCTLALAGSLVAASSMFVTNSNLLFAAFWIAAAIIEAITHCMARASFYALPAQERSVPRLK